MVQPNMLPLALDANYRAAQNSSLVATFRGDYSLTGHGTYVLTYKAFARPGSSIDDPVWQISMQTYDVHDNIIEILWPELPNGVPSNNYSFIWANRAGYAYS